MEGGRAIANVLFGDVNPSGKIPLTFLKSINDSPAHRSTKTFPGENLQVFYEERIYVGYRHFEKNKIDPLFPFGFGLSYTSFSFDKAELDKTILKSQNDSLKLIVSVKNTGNRSGSEVIQVYSEDVEASVDRPIKELVGFEKVYLEKGETKKVELKIRARDLAFYDVESHDWKVEPGEFILHIGNSSATINFQKKVYYKP